MLIKRMFMTGEDGGTKSIVAPPAPTGTPPTPAPGGTDPAKPQSATVDIASLVKEIRDGVFADLRKTGLLKKSAIREMDAAKPGELPGQNASADLGAVRSFDRAMGRLGYATNLSERQYARAEKAFVEERPDDAEAWLKDYFTGYGASTAQTQANQTENKQATQPRTAIPVTSTAAPHTPQTSPDEPDLLSMSQADVERLIKTKGLSWYSALFRKQVTGKRFSVAK